MEYWENDLFKQQFEKIIKSFVPEDNLFLKKYLNGLYSVDNFNTIGDEVELNFDRTPSISEKDIENIYNYYEFKDAVIISFSSHTIWIDKEGNRKKFITKERKSYLDPDDDIHSPENISLSNIKDILDNDELMARCGEIFINLNNIEKLLKYERCINSYPTADGGIAIKTSKNSEFILTNKNAVKTVFEKAPEIKMLYLDKIKEMITYKRQMIDAYEKKIKNLKESEVHTLTPEDELYIEVNDLEN